LTSSGLQAHTAGTSLGSVDWKRLNAAGPYSMGVWIGSDGTKVGNQESMAGRAEAMLASARKAILSNFSLADLKEMTILDVGCNDGWLLHNLSDLPFKAMTGVEPRVKNVEKGKVVREELGLENDIEFIVGTVDVVEGRVFDIVLNTGVLYHVDSVIDFLRSLRKVCGNFLFLESRTLDSGLINKKLVKQSELVDLPYKFGKKAVGLSTHKFEKSYSDGSAAASSVVSLPTPEAIMMYLEGAGFEEVVVELDPETFRSALYRKDRPLDGICLSARVPLKQLNSLDQQLDSVGYTEARMVEELHAKTVIPEKYLRMVQASSHGGKSNFSVRGLLTRLWLNPKNFKRNFIESLLLSRLRLSSEELIVFKDLKYNPSDKIQLELGKSAFLAGDLETSKKILSALVSGPNADWRSTYRAFYYLSRLGHDLGDRELESESRAALETSNPNWPLDRHSE